VTGNLAAVTVAFSHLVFNLSGIAIWWPFRIVPITMAEKFAGIAVKKKAMPILYVIVVFFLVPILLILISR
jgi:sodium-dependent phosphate cotransporter